MDFENLHQILRSLYDEMMPLCSDMTDIAKGLAGLGALFYVALRVWQSLSRAEPIDVFPLLRPFAIGLAIMFFPTIVLGTLNSVMSPIVQGTHSMLETQTFDMNEYRAQKDKLEYEAMKRNPETAYLVSNEEFDKQLDELGSLAWGVALGAVGGAGVCAGFPYLPQLLSGSGGLEVSQDDGCSHVQLSDTGGDYRCFPHLGARPFQLDASRCHCHDLYQRVLC